MRHLSIIVVVAILILALFLAGCQPSQVVATLEAAVAAAEVAIPVIAVATGLPPQIATLIVTYLQQVNIAAAQASTILADTTLSSAQKSAQIVQLFANVALGCNCLPPGTPQEVATVVQAVANAVATFLQNFAAATKTAALAKPVNIKISSSDRAKLASIHTRAEANLAKLKGGVK